VLFVQSNLVLRSLVCSSFNSKFPFLYNLRGLHFAEVGIQSLYGWPGRRRLIVAIRSPASTTRWLFRFRSSKTGRPQEKETQSENSPHDQKDPGRVSPTVTPRESPLRSGLTVREALCIRASGLCVAQQVEKPIHCSLMTVDAFAWVVTSFPFCHDRRCGMSMVG